jgi:hypothetical protein
LDRYYSHNKIQKWRITEECTQSDHNLTEFQFSIQNHKNNLNRVAGDYTRKYATPVVNWNQFQAKVKMWNTQWRDWIQDAKTKEELDKAITEMWNRHWGRQAESAFPPSNPRLITVHGGPHT